MERLLRYGGKSLSAAELLAVVLGPGGPVPASLMALQLLQRYGTLPVLAGMRAERLCREHGMGLVRAARLIAAVEFGRRSNRATRKFGVQVQRPADLRPLLEEEFRGCDREHFLGFYLDARHQVLAIETISIGSVNASLVHPREVFKPAIAVGAAAVIAAHNHPSGCVRPSGEDLDLTRRLIRCGRLLGIELLDHIISGGEEFLSLRECGWPVPEGDRCSPVPGPEG